jgi:hypothetical protein
MVYAVALPRLGSVRESGLSRPSDQAAGPSET